ncbi:hypothetical protein MTR_6g049290 [Medicago truncatula]|uniref:Gag-pol polyprotein n=1 Tax=Medicago truncatula TaxID=3880 RepID=A0A072UA42_MEDTR|nr:hypothetical protein MTR_6g049290 [Medicago truncatula]
MSCSLSNLSAFHGLFQTIFDQNLCKTCPEISSSQTWKAVLKGWEHPVTLDADDNRTYVLKPDEEWNVAEDELVLGNSKSLNALFNGVDKNMFSLIRQCTLAKDACEILKIAHEGTTKVFEDQVLKLSYLDWVLQDTRPHDMVSNCKTKGETYKIGGFSLRKHCQKDMVCHHQKGDIVKKISFLDLVWF